MIIGIDASRANKQNKTGTEWYSWHLIEELKKIVSADDKVLLYSNSPLVGDLAAMPNDSWREKVLAWPPRYLWTQIRLWWELFRSPPDVLLVPAHTIPFLPLPRRIKVCVNVHDVGFKRFPKLYKPIQVWYHDLTMRRIKQRADVIITISEFSRREIMELYGVPEEKIKVVYLGYDAAKYRLPKLVGQELEQVLAKYKINRPYLLYVGRLEKKKNIGNMVAAFALVKEHQPDLKLVLAGSAGNEYEAIKKIILDNKLEQEIILPGYIDDEDLVPITQAAEIFLFPTLYEGFGLPIIESMAAGTPVITSNMAPHNEVGGEAAVYADPKSAEDLAEKISSLLDDVELRAAHSEKGLARAQQFSWAKTAKEIYGIIKT